MLRACLILLFSVSVMAQEAKPKIEFTSSSYDFGSVDKGEKVDFNFEFKNSGTANLEIQDVKPTCGCTTVKPDKTSYAPGESGKIPVTFDSTRFSGAVTKTIMVLTNDPDQPRYQLKLSGKIRTELEATPASLALPNVKRSEKINREITVTTEVLDKVEVTGVTSTLNWVKTQIKQIDDKTVKVMVSFDGKDAPADRDVFQGSISLATNGEQMPELKTSIFVRFMKPIQARPGSVYFFSTKEGQTREALVQLQPIEVDNLTIEGANSDLDFITVEVVDKTGRVMVKMAENAPKGRFTGKITVKTGVSDHPELVIPVRGSVI